MARLYSNEEVTILGHSRCWEGIVYRCEHTSAVLGDIKAKFSVYMPDCASVGNKVPQLWALAGLTCNDENFLMKAGAIEHASKHKFAIVAPDTSPRGVGVPGDDEDYDLGTGAGFYINATNSPWASHYRMYDYVVTELPTVVNTFFHVNAHKCGLFGHSMGGHGALVIALKNPDRYPTVSVAAPITNPMECPWGKKAFTAYLGNDKKLWKEWDSCELVSHYEGPPLRVRVEQGGDDAFLDTQLHPGNLLRAWNGNDNISLNYNLREGYDHSYYFVQTFIKELIAHHLRHFAS